MTRCQPTRAVLRKTILAGLVGALLLAAPAHAAVGVQDDEALKYDTAGFLARADQLGADWVRIMIPYGRWHDGEDGAYVHAAQAAHDSGRRVMVSLLSWYDYPTPDQWATFAREVVPRLAPYVDAWSPMNEPNWPGMSPHNPTNCVVSDDVSTRAVTSTVRNGHRIERRFKRAKHGRYIRRRAHHHVRYVRARRAVLRRHRARFRVVHRRVALTRSQTVLVATGAQRRTCSAEALGVAYRRVWDRVAPILAADDGAVMVAGDLCPGDTLAFMDAFASLGPFDVKPDVFGTHYSSSGEMRAEIAYARAHGMRAWETEWGVPSDPSAADWLAAYAALTGTGVDRVFLYDTGSDVGWDTRVPVGALESIAAMP